MYEFFSITALLFCVLWPYMLASALIFGIITLKRGGGKPTAALGEKNTTPPTLPAKDGLPQR